MATNPNPNALETCKVINDLLSSKPFDVTFYNECKKSFISNYISYSDPTTRTATASASVPTVAESWFKRYLSLGVAPATNAYSHITDKPTLIYIALYSLMMFYIDDVFETNVEHISGFNERFFQGIPHEDLFLDTIDKMLLETQLHYPRFASNVIITSTIDYYPLGGAADS